MELFSPIRVHDRVRPPIPMVELVGVRHPVSNPIQTATGKRILGGKDVVSAPVICPDSGFTFHKMAARVLWMDGTLDGWWMMGIAGWVSAILRWTGRSTRHTDQRWRWQAPVIPRPPPFGVPSGSDHPGFPK